MPATHTPSRPAAVDQGTAAPSAPGEPQRALRAGGLIARLSTAREGSIIAVTAIALVYFAITAPNFLTGGNFKTLLPYFAPYAIMAAGEVFVMVSGEIDLSIGAMYLFAPFLMHELSGAFPLIPALLIALLICTALGAINGLAVSLIGISSFVATLGMLFALDGVTLVMSHATPITPAGTTILGTTAFQQLFGGGTYSELFWALGIIILLQLMLSRTRWGLYTVALGGNRLGAGEAGVRTRLVMTRNFMMCALLAAFVGILEAVRTTTATPDPSGSNEILFQAISAAVIGGTLLQGGSGTVVGAFVGALFLGILHDGLIVKGINANYLDLYLGIAIVIAMAISRYVQKARTGGSDE
jgi:simple sugar transport system permease protein